MIYTVTVTRTEWAEVEVEADNEIDARANAFQKAILDDDEDELVWETSNIETKI